MNTGLTKIVNQAGKMLNEALNSSSRHSGPGSTPGTGSGRNPVSPDALDLGFRRGDGAVADGKPITLSDDAIAANRRTADALGKVRGVGDLPRFTADAINTDPRRFRALEQVFRSLRFFTCVIVDAFGRVGGSAPAY